MLRWFLLLTNVLISKTKKIVIRVILMYARIVGIKKSLKISLKMFKYMNNVFCLFVVVISVFLFSSIAVGADSDTSSSAPTDPEHEHITEQATENVIVVVTEQPTEQATDQQVFVIDRNIEFLDAIHFDLCLIAFLCAVRLGFDIVHTFKIWGYTQ